jgi:hypothetical protein
MIPRYLVPILSALACTLATTTHAGDINECSIVVEGRAELIIFDARRANDTKVELTGILAGPDGEALERMTLMTPLSPGSSSANLMS